MELKNADTRRRTIPTMYPDSLNACGNPSIPEPTIVLVRLEAQLKIVAVLTALAPEGADGLTVAYEWGAIADLKQRRVMGNIQII